MLREQAAESRIRSSGGVNVRIHYEVCVRNGGGGGVGLGCGLSTSCASQCECEQLAGKAKLPPAKQHRLYTSPMAYDTFMHQVPLSVERGQSFIDAARSFCSTYGVDPNLNVARLVSALEREVNIPQACFRFPRRGPSSAV